MSRRDDKRGITAAKAEGGGSYVTSALGNMSTFITLSSWSHTLRVDTQLCVAACSTLAVPRRRRSPLEEKRRICRRRIYRASKPPSLVRRKTIGRLPYQRTTTCHAWWSMTPPRGGGVRVREIGSENLFAPSHGRPTPRREYGIVRVTACVEIANGEGFSALRPWASGSSQSRFEIEDPDLPCARSISSGQHFKWDYVTRIVHATLLSI